MEVLKMFETIDDKPFLCNNFVSFYYVCRL